MALPKADKLRLQLCTRKLGTEASTFTQRYVESFQMASYFTSST